MINIAKLMKSVKYDQFEGKEKSLVSARKMIKKQYNKTNKKMNKITERYERQMARLEKKNEKLFSQLEYLDDMGIH